MKQELPAFIKHSMQKEFTEIVKRFKASLKRAKGKDMKNVLQHLRDNLFLVLATNHCIYGGTINPYIDILNKVLVKFNVEKLQPIRGTKCEKR